MNSPRKHTSKTIQRINSSGDKVRRARLSKKMRIAAKISNTLETLSWNDKDLASRLDKYSSEISKWLKGDHNFTIDTLSDIEEILNIKLLDLEDKNKRIPQMSVNVFLTMSLEDFTKDSFGDLRSIMQAGTINVIEDAPIECN